MFSAEPGNLYAKHSYKHSGIANDKAVDIREGGEGGVTISAKRLKTAQKPREVLVKTTSKKHARRAIAATCKQVASYRPDLQVGARLGGGGRRGLLTCAAPAGKRLPRAWVARGRFARGVVVLARLPQPSSTAPGTDVCNGSPPLATETRCRARERRAPRPARQGRCPEVGVQTLPAGAPVN